MGLRTIRRMPAVRISATCFANEWHASAAVPAAFTASCVTSVHSARTPQRSARILPASGRSAADRARRQSPTLDAPGRRRRVTRESHPGRSARHARSTSARRARTYVAGRVIVKFRDGVVDGRAPVARCPRVSRTAHDVPTRPSYAELRHRPHRSGRGRRGGGRALRGSAPTSSTRRPPTACTPMFVPNDPLYEELQWNLPLIDLERAWDIQPAAGSTITVAVLDTGVAYHERDDHRARRRRSPTTTGIRLSGARPRDDPVRGGAAAGRRRRRRPYRRAARFHLERRPAARLRRPRHARQRHRSAS